VVTAGPMHMADCDDGGGDGLRNVRLLSTTDTACLRRFFQMHACSELLRALRGIKVWLNTDAMMMMMMTTLFVSKCTY
jgi:hypothetical protein